MVAVSRVPKMREIDIKQFLARLTAFSFSKVLPVVGLLQPIDCRADELFLVSYGLFLLIDSFGVA